jgi:hypothetical protein
MRNNDEWIGGALTLRACDRSRLSVSQVWRTNWMNGSETSPAETSAAPEPGS